MTITRNESLPTSWSDGRDIPFFRVTARLFSAQFCLGASVLLAGNDADGDTAEQSPWAPIECTGTRQPVTQTDADLVPVRVRRTPND